MKIIKVESPVREWETYYDPKLVGKFLLWFDKKYYSGEKYQIIEIEPPFQPGMYISMHEPSLGEFLRWCASPPK